MGLCDNENFLLPLHALMGCETEKRTQTPRGRPGSEEKVVMIRSTRNATAKMSKAHLDCRGWREGRVCKVGFALLKIVFHTAHDITCTLP